MRRSTRAGNAANRGRWLGVVLLALAGLAAPAAAQEVFLEKATNGADADSAPGPAVLVGSTVNWTYRVTAGSRDLVNVAVSDDQGVVVSCPQATLGAGESMTCTGSGAAAPGQYANLGTVNANTAIGNLPVSASDPSHYFGLAELALDLEKSTNGFDADTAPGPTLPVGSPVAWDYVVTNTSATDTIANISVTDDRGVAVICPGSTLAAGESMTCTASGTVQVGQYTNLGTATGELPGPIQLVATDRSHYRGQVLVLQKRTNGVDADTPPGPTIPVGAAVNWTYTVSNPGPETVTNLVVTDDQGVVVSCPQTTLTAGQNMVCTGSGLAEVGQYANLGSVTGELPGAVAIAASDPSHYVGFLPNAVILEKATNGFDADTAPGPVLPVGVPVSWTYEVTNPGLDPMSNIVVSDSQGVVVSCPQSSLVGGESMTCTANGVTIAGSYENLGTVEAELPGPTPVTDSDFSHYYGQDLDLDWGDAPAPYPTGLATLGASHLLPSAVFLGACADSELDGQPSALADGDDLGAAGAVVVGTCATPGDDVDGVTFLDPLLSGATVDIEVTASAPCTLTAFIDFNVDGDWNDPADALFPGGTPLAAGVNALSFSVPLAAVGGETFARFRCTTDSPPEGGAFGPGGQADDGEVEDYRVEIELVLEATLVDSPGTPAMPGDTIGYRADITSVAGTAKGLTFEVPLDPNTTLAGGVTTTPLAIDDGYRGDPAVPTSVDGIEQPRLIENDFGVPAPTAVPVTGQPTTLGGAVDIDADGSFIYTPPPGAVGGEVDTFTYDVENGIPPSAPVTDTATATIVLGGEPEAQDDESGGLPAYFVAAGGSLVVPDGATDPVERNDSVGSPPATLSHFGGADLGGAVTDNLAGDVVTPLPGYADGSLTVDGLGAFTFVTPTGLTGPWRFEYRLTNPNGTSDATVTIEVQVAPDAIDDGPAMGSVPGDPFHTDLGVPIDTTSHATPSVLANDDLGIPAGAVTSYGTSSSPTDQPSEGAPTPTDEGGTVQVSGNGNFVYTPPSGAPLGGAAFVGYDAFGYVLGNGAGSDAAVVTIGVGAPAQCVNDSYTATFNIGIQHPAASGVILGTGADSGTDIAVTSVQGAGANVGSPTATTDGGSVTLNADGSFTYDPPAGDDQDTFTYTVGNGFGDSSSCTVTVNMSGATVWFIDNTHMGGNDGTLENPFQTIAAFNASGLPATNDLVYLFAGSGYNEADGFDLLDGQQLYGQGIDLGPLVAEDAASRNFPPPTGSTPQLAATAGDGVEVGANNTVRGLDIGNTPGFFGLRNRAATSVATLTVSDVEITGTGGAVRIDSGGNLDGVTFDVLASSSSAGANLWLDAAGSPTITSGGTGLSGSAASSPAVRIGGTLSATYPGAVTKANAGSLVSISSHTTGTVTFSGTLGATAGDGIQASGAGGTYNFSGTTTLNGGDAGIDILGGSSGSFTFSNAGSSIVGPAGGRSFNVAASSATASYAGTITQPNAQAAVAIFGNPGGSVTLTGAIDADTTSATAIDLDNHGTVTLSGGMDIDTTSGIGFQAINGGTVNVSGVNTVTTTTGRGVNIGSTIGGSGVTFASVAAGGTNGIRLDSTGAGAFTVTGATTITGATGNSIHINNVDGAISFAGVTINGRGATGVFIDDADGPSVAFGATSIPNPGAATGYGIRVEDSAAAVTFASATISNTVVGTAATFTGTRPIPLTDGDGDAVFLKNNTGSFALNGGTLTSSGDNAIDIRSSTNVTIDGVTLSGTPSTVNSGLQVYASSNLTIRNSLIRNTGNDASAAALVDDHGIWIRDLSGTFVIEDSSLVDSTGYVLQNGSVGNANRAVELQNQGVDLDVTVTGSTFRNWDFQGLNLRFIGGTLDVDIGDNTAGGSNTFQNINGSAVNTGPSADAIPNDHTLDLLMNTFNTVGIGADPFSSKGGTTTVRIVNNTLTTTGADAFRLVAFNNNPNNTPGAGNAQYFARVTGNVVTGLATAYTGMGGGFGFFVAIEDAATAKVLIDNNQVTGHTNGSGDPTGMLTTQHQRGGDLDIAFSNNTATDMPTNFFGAVFLQVAGATGGENDQCVDFDDNSYSNAVGVFGGVYAFDMTGNSGDDSMDVAGFAGGNEAAMSAYLATQETTGPHTVLYFGDAPTGNACNLTGVPPAP